MSFGWLGAQRAEFCKGVSNPPARLDAKAEYVAVAYGTQENGAARMMVTSWRPGNQRLKLLVQKCPIGGSELERRACSQEMSAYLSSLGVVAVPVFIALFSLLIWQVCCWMTLCRCCRRCCLCSERKGPRKAELWQKVAIVLCAVACTMAIMACAAMAFLQSGKLTSGISDMFCHAVTMADEALNGSTDAPVFLGLDVGIQKTQLLRNLLQENGQMLSDARRILDESATFSSALDDMTMKLGHMRRMLALVGSQGVKEHSCWFCRRAAGRNATGTDAGASGAELGLLGQLQADIAGSYANAMRSIQVIVAASLTGRPVAAASAALLRGGAALEVAKQVYGAVLVDGVVARRGQLQSLESMRHSIFQLICLFCIAHALVVSNLAFWYARKSQAQNPRSAPACASWCCAFVAVTAGLLFGGLLLLLLVPIAELCNFWRYDLLSNSGISNYYRQLGMFSATDPYQNMDGLAAGIFHTCLTPNGTGALLEAVQLSGPLHFQEALDASFAELNSRVGGQVVEMAGLDLLVSQATNYGGLFLLAPDKPLPLQTSAAPKLLGSSVDADDRIGPDGNSLVYGLNTYAELITGPGEYSFQHGTAGGRVLITPTTPTASSVSGSALQVQNALDYARLKEQLLSEPGIFRCDILDASYRVTVRTCGFDEYKRSVIEWASQVRAAGIELRKRAAVAKQLIAEDLKNSLQPMLVAANDLRTTFRCRFFWKRWEDFDAGLCNNTLTSTFQGFLVWTVVAGFGLGLIVVHYKTWRHFLDNAVVGEETDYYARKFNYIEKHNPGH